MLYTGELAHRLRTAAATLARTPALGLVAQRFGHGLLEELDAFDAFVVTLEAEAMRSDWSAPPERIAAWVRPMTRRLEILVEMLEAIRGMRGGALLRVLLWFCVHGSEEYCVLARRLVRGVWPPMARICCEWVLKGVLDDAHREFFVDERGELVGHMLFVSAALAERVRAVGAAVQVLRVRKSREVVVSPSALATLQQHDDDPAAYVAALLDAAEGEANALVLAFMRDEAHLMDHLVAMKRFFLHAQGDFFGHLIDAVQTTLRLPVDALAPSDFTGHLEHALLASNAKTSPAHVLSRLDVALLPGQGALGWDCFCLAYHVTDKPLALVLDAGALDKYRAVFVFLWRLRRALRSLETTWFEHAAQTRAARDLHSTVFDVVHRCHLLRAEMVHFASNLLSYVMFEVVEASWEELKVRRFACAQTRD